MTVIDVQVFNSSHTETLEQHTHIHMHTGLQTNTEARCTCMFTLCGDSHAYTQVCILPHVAEEVLFNKGKAEGKILYIRLSRATVISVAEENKGVCESVVCA